MVVDALDRTVTTVSDRATAFLLSATLPERDGFLQAVHPVAKLVGLVSLVVVTVATDDVRPSQRCSVSPSPSHSPHGFR